MVRRAYVTLTNDDSQAFSTAQINSMNKTALMETVYPYGLYAQAPLGAYALLFTVQSNEENLVGLCYTPDNPKSGILRFKNLKPGEVILGNVLTQTFIKLDAEGNVVIDNANNITINAAQEINVNATTVNVTADNVNVDGNFTVTDANLTKLGQGGSSQPIARLGDQVTTVISGTPYMGTITACASVNTSI